MRPWQTVATVTTADGPLELRRRGDDEYLIVIAGRVLMTSAARRSEEALATLALARPAKRVLVGGLGMGYTLRAALDCLPADARVVVAELTPAVVEWCRGPLSGLTRGAAMDPRVQVVVEDVAQVIAAARPGEYGAVLLDLYEGPYDDPLYGVAALARVRRALGAGGVLAVWSEDADPPFEARLGAAGFSVAVHRPGRGGRRHVVYVGTKGVSFAGVRSPEGPGPR